MTLYSNDSITKTTYTVTIIHHEVVSHYNIAIAITAHTVTMDIVAIPLYLRVARLQRSLLQAQIAWMSPVSWHPSLTNLIGVHALATVPETQIYGSVVNRWKTGKSENPERFLISPDDEMKICRTYTRV